MQTRNIFTAVVLAFGVASFAACADPVSAPAAVSAAAFARNPGEGADKSQSCEQDGGTRTSGDKKTKNACATGIPSFKFVAGPGVDLAAYFMSYEPLVANCVQTEGSFAYVDQFTTTFTDLCAGGGITTNLGFVAGGYQVTPSTPGACQVIEGEGVFYQCLITNPQEVITITLPPQN